MKMNAKKRICFLLIAVMAFSLVTFSAFADEVYDDDLWGVSIPSSAKSFRDHVNMDLQQPIASLNPLLGLVPLCTWAQST